MSTRLVILGCNSFYARAFEALVSERGWQVKGFQHYGPWLDGWADVVVNFASKSLVVESWAAPHEWMKANGDELAYLVDLHKEKETKFIHVSTPEVYGSTPFWVEEDYPFHPTTPYAVSRAAGDMMLNAYHKAYGFPSIITRTANIYGPGQQDYRLIPTAIRHKKEGKKLLLHGGGWTKRSFIHIKDACEALYLLCMKGMIGQTYHISTQDAHWVREVVSMIGCEYGEVEDRLGKDAMYLLNSDKLRSMGWSEKITLEEGLCELQT